MTTDNKPARPYHPYDVWPKPSDAVNAMIVGLHTWPRKPKCQINMMDYGYVDEEADICFGCAATATVLTQWPELPVDAGVRWGYSEHLADFEDMIDDLRGGSVGHLFEYYGFNPLRGDLPSGSDLPHLRTKTWEQDLPAYERFRDHLIEQGL